MVALTLAAPADARSAAQITGPSDLIGEVRDARAKTPTTIVPDELPVVADADVVVTPLGLQGRTDARGQFAFRSIPVQVIDPARPYQKVTIVVTKAGFGTRTIVDAPVRPGGNYLRIYAELSLAPMTTTYVPPAERPRRTRPGTGTSASGGRGPGLARPFLARIEVVGQERRVGLVRTRTGGQTRRAKRA